MDPVTLFEPSVSAIATPRLRRRVRLRWQAVPVIATLALVSSDSEPSIWREMLAQSPSAVAVLIAALVSYRLGIRQVLKTSRVQAEQEAALAMVQAAHAFRKTLPVHSSSAGGSHELLFSSALGSFLEEWEIQRPALWGVPLVHEETFNVINMGRLLLARCRHGMSADSWSDEDMDNQWLKGQSDAQVTPMLEDYQMVLENYARTLTEWRTTGLWKYPLGTPGSLAVPVATGWQRQVIREDSAMGEAWAQQRRRLAAERVRKGPLLLYRRVRAKVRQWRGRPLFDLDMRH